MRRLIITSPPYLSVHGYAYDNRARLWFLGYDYKAVQAQLFSSQSIENYLNYVSMTIASLATHMMRDSTCVIIFGDVRSKRDGSIIKVGELFAEYWIKNYGKVMQLQQIVVDRIRPTRRRYFNLKNTQGIRCERILILYKGFPRCRKITFNWKEQGGSAKSAL